MTDITAIKGSALPLPIDNLDTDQIMPKQFLRIIDKAGLADGLLYDLRFDAAGQAIAGSVLNDARYRSASILLGGANFGCGSSREHAVWGLQQYGFTAVVASSFAEIFYSNAMNNRLLLVQLTPHEVAALQALVQADPQTQIHIDLAGQRVTASGGLEFGFAIGARHKQMVMQGMDTVQLSLTALPQIEAFEARHFQAHPWAAVL